MSWPPGGAPQTIQLGTMRKDPAQLRCASLGASLRRCAVFSELPAKELPWIASFVVQKRLARWLLRRCPRPLADKPALVELDQPKRVPAAELGAASETLSRTLAELRARKLIAVRGRTILILKPPELEKLFQAQRRRTLVFSASSPRRGIVVSSFLGERRVMVAIAGPNGGGKTTFFYSHLREAGRYYKINADPAVSPLEL